MFGRANELVGFIEALYQNLPLCFAPAVRTDLEKRVVKTQMQMLAFCCRQMIVGTLALMRCYKGECLLSLRRAIESGVFAFHISQHPEKADIWLQAGQNDKDYKTYRKAFKNELCFCADPNHPDYILAVFELKAIYDACSKLMHSSVLGLSEHFINHEATRFRMIFPDTLLSDSEALCSVFISHLVVHLRILQLFAAIVTPNANPEILAIWYTDYANAVENIERQRQAWKIGGDVIADESPGATPAEEETEASL